MKDASAEILQIEAGLKSRTQAIAERGYDAEQVDREIAAERKREGGAGPRLPAAGIAGAGACEGGGADEDAEDQRQDARPTTGRRRRGPGNPARKEGA
jgi:capsid protein